MHRSFINILIFLSLVFLVTCKEVPIVTTSTVNHQGKCPPNFVYVSESVEYGEKPFCVAKYEMKASKNKKERTLESMPNGKAVVRVSRDEADKLCQSLGSNFRLISNFQWQAIAHEIELNPKNWSGGKLGSIEGINRGHSDGSPNRYLPASSNDSDGCFMTEQRCNLENWNSQRRTHFLKSNDIIWDFAGNLHEWVLEPLISPYLVDVYATRISSDRYPKTTAVNGRFYNMKQLFGPNGEYPELINRFHGGMGLVRLSLPGGSARRGGRWASGYAAGIYSTTSGLPDDLRARGIGVRCVMKLQGRVPEI
ncbi:MAG: hypothetical protein KDD61_16320 [Bdellovibrionales bacterium]|nr:hypothetical protein [Bdellovibrionales bacterium]